MGISTDGFPITPFLNSWAYYQAAHTKQHSYTASFQRRHVSFRADSFKEAFQLASNYFRTRNKQKLIVLLDSTITPLSHKEKPCP